jgi:hypothetical protein
LIIPQVVGGRLFIAWFCPLPVAFAWEKEWGLYQKGFLVRSLRIWANRITQLKGPEMDLWITKVLSLEKICQKKIYESARQTLESQDIIGMEEMILWLTDTELRLETAESKKSVNKAREVD